MVIIQIPLVWDLKGPMIILTGIKGAELSRVIQATGSPIQRLREKDSVLGVNNADFQEEGMNDRNKDLILERLEKLEFVLLATLEYINSGDIGRASVGISMAMDILSGLRTEIKEGLIA